MVNDAVGAASGLILAPGLADQMVSPVTGPVTRLLELPPDPWASHVHRFAAVGKAVDRAHAAARPVTGIGRHTERAAARDLALLEFAERLALFEPAALRSAAPAASGCPLSDQTIGAVDLLTGQRVSRPAAPFCVHPAECPVALVPGRPSTSGAAAGSSASDALVRGLLELLERDALMFAWRCGVRPARLDLPAPELTPAGDGGSAVYLDLSFVHAVPTVLCIVRGAVDGHQARGVGCAAKRTAQEAASHALGEASSAFGMCAERLTSAGPDGLDGPEVFAHFADNAYHYLRAAPMAALDALADAAPKATGIPVPLHGDTATVLSGLTGRLREHGIAVFAADVTPRWLRPLGLHVVVTRSPDLFPLELGPGNPEDARRLLNHPFRRALANADLNLAPVPLA